MSDTWPVFLAFTQPKALWLLALVPLALLVGSLSPRPAERWRRAASLALRALIFSALVLALAGTQVRRPVRNLTVVFLVDASDSISPAARATAVAYLREALADMPTGDRAAVVVFGKDALVERTASELRTLDTLASVPVRTRTDIAEAIQLGLALLPGDTQKRLVLLSDGQANEGDARAAAALAAARGVPLDVVPLQSGLTGPEVLVAGLDAPSHLRQGQRFELVVRLQANVATQARLRVFGENRLLDERVLDLPAGETQVAIPLTAENPGFQWYRATVEAPADTRPQNNEAAAFTIVAGPPRVLVVARDPAETGPLVTALADARVQVDQVAPDALPVDLTQLATYDAVVLVNVPSPQVLPAAQEALRGFVRDLGRGLVMVGGPESFGAGLWRNTPVEEALPVSMDVRTREREPNLALVVAVDKSGSMGRCHCNDPNDPVATARRIEAGLPKVDIAKDAIIQASFALGKMDLLGVVAFDSAARWVLEPQPYPGPAAVEQAIAGIEANGPTNIYAGLSAAEAWLTQTPARIKHIILVTDGWSRAGDYQPLAEQLRQEGITLTVVAAGRGSALNDLARLAEEGGGRFYPVQELGQIPRIFLRETVRVFGRYIVEEPFRPAPASPSRILQGIDPTRLPVLLGYNGTTLKPTARAALLTWQGDPLLAQWRFGLGRSVAWTSDLAGRWAADLVTWERFGDFVAQLVGWTLPTPQSSTLVAEAEVRGGEARVHITARDESGQPRNFVQTEARFIAADGSTLQVDVPQVGPGEYEVGIPLERVGAYLVQVVQRDARGEPVDSTTLGLVVPYSPEYRLLQPAEALLRDLAQATGGRLGLTPDFVFQRPGQPVTRARDLWPTLLLLSILFLPLDIAARRLAVRREEVQAAWEWVRGRLPRRRVPRPAAERALGTLFEAKRRAARRRPGPREAPSSPSSPTPPPEPRPEPSPSRRGMTPDMPQSPPSPTTPPAEEDTLARLRAAKRRRRR